MDGISLNNALISEKVIVPREQNYPISITTLHASKGSNAENIRNAIKSSYHFNLEDYIISKIISDNSDLFSLCFSKAVKIKQLNLISLSSIPVIRYKLRSFIYLLKSFIYPDSSKHAEENLNLSFYENYPSSSCQSIQRSKYLSELDKYFISLSYAYRKLVSLNPKENIEILNTLDKEGNIINLTNMPILFLGINMISLTKLYPKNLCSLNLTNCGLADDNMKILLESLTVLTPNLKVLNVSHNNKITDFSFEQIIKAVFSYWTHQKASSICPFSNLEKLILVGNKELFLSIDMCTLFILPQLKYLDASGTSLCSNWKCSKDLVAISSLLRIHSLNIPYQYSSCLNLGLLLKFWINLLKTTSLSSIDNVYCRILENMSTASEYVFPSYQLCKIEQYLILYFDKSLLTPMTILIFFKIIQKDSVKRQRIRIASGLNNDEGNWISNDNPNLSKINLNLNDFYK